MSKKSHRLLGLQDKTELIWLIDIKKIEGMIIRKSSSFNTVRQIIFIKIHLLKKSLFSIVEI